MDKAKLTLVLQCYPGDMYAAEDLAELICDIEPVRREDVDFVLIYRRDVNLHFVLKFKKMALAKFRSFLGIKCRRYGTGWPIGCNDLWQDGMRNVAIAHRDGLLTSPFCLTFEPDCVPMQAKWLDLLIAEAVTLEREGYRCGGHVVHDDGVDAEHINGNGLYATDILKSHPILVGSNAHEGWDYCHRKLLMSIGRNSNLILSQHKRPTITHEALVATHKNDVVPALLHGVKDNSGLNIIRAMLNDGTLHEDRTQAPTNAMLVKRAIKRILKTK